jgi:hypothetical protein
VWDAVCFSGGPLPFIGPRREGEAVVQRPGDKATQWWSGRSVGARSSAGDEERRAGEGLVGCGVLRGSSGRLLLGPGWRGAAGGGGETVGDGGELQWLRSFRH